MKKKYLKHFLSYKLYLLISILLLCLAAYSNISHSRLEIIFITKYAFYFLVISCIIAFIEQLVITYPKLRKMRKFIFKYVKR